MNLAADEIKWYITPVVFGGDPSLADNVTWVALDQHAQLVKFWNGKYGEIREFHALSL